MLTAKEAFETTTYVRESLVADQLLKVSRLISGAVADGRFGITVEKLDYINLKHLIEMGYKFMNGKDEMGNTNHYISWSNK